MLAPPANVVDMLDQPLVWIDLEMTGLDHRTDVILEIAVIVTDGTLETVIEGPDLVIGATTEQLESMDPFVIDMHATSGLDELVKASSLTVGQAEEQVMSWLIGHVPEPRLAPLAGNSVHADRAFMFEHMPTLEQYVHYRNVDVCPRSKSWPSGGIRTTKAPQKATTTSTGPCQISVRQSTNCVSTGPRSFLSRMRGPEPPRSIAAVPFDL